MHMLNYSLVYELLLLYVLIDLFDDLHDRRPMVCLKVGSNDMSLIFDNGMCHTESVIESHTLSSSILARPALNVRILR